MGQLGVSGLHGEGMAAWEVRANESRMRQRGLRPVR